MDALLQRPFGKTVKPAPPSLSGRTFQDSPDLIAPLRRSDAPSTSASAISTPRSCINLARPRRFSALRCPAGRRSISSPRRSGSSRRRGTSGRSKPCTCSFGKVSVSCVAIRSTCSKFTRPIGTTGGRTAPRSGPANFLICRTISISQMRRSFNFCARPGRADSAAASESPATTRGISVVSSASSTSSIPFVAYNYMPINVTPREHVIPFAEAKGMAVIVAGLFTFLFSIPRGWRTEGLITSANVRINNSRIFNSCRKTAEFP